MNRSFLFTAIGACMASIPAISMAAERVNPITAPYTTVYQIPPFDQIEAADYLPALKTAIANRQAQIDRIANNPEAPTFDNTILAMEEAGDEMSKVALLFNSIEEALSSPEIVEVAEVFNPLLSQSSDEIMMNDKLFSRIKTLYDNRKSANYTTPQLRAVEEAYRSFVRNGALLNDADKERLKAINTKLADLYFKFNRNLLSATNDFAVFVADPSQLSGLSKGVIAVAAEEAANRGKAGQWAFTLHAPSRLAVLESADNRDLRQQIYQGYMNLAGSGQYNNKPIINEILKTRSEKAKLLGYPTFAAYMTENVMAKTPQAAEELLMKIWTPAVGRANQEISEMQAIVDEQGLNFKIAPWDYYYYAEKLRQKKYAIDTEEVAAYFPVENVKKGIFTLANRLYGINFTPLPDAPKYHPDVDVYDVTDVQGNHVAVFMTDYFTRPSKRQGAWMYVFNESYTDRDGKSVRPIVYNVANFAKPTAEQPSLLSLDDVETLFHEFGHGLHGMLTKAALRSQSGTNVDRDFVELPSQINEHWAMEPELLREYAHHYVTGEVIPDTLINKLLAASTHNQGFTTTELVGAALLDLKYGALNPKDDVDVDAFEAEVAQQLGMPSEIAYRYRSPYFKHIFGSDGYASGYYTYLWAEVLDADGYELFKEKGVFDPETARSFRENILEMGGSEDPMTLYIKFRGHEPTPDALLRNRGLIPANN